MPAKDMADAPPSSVPEPVVVVPGATQEQPDSGKVILYTTGGVDEFRSADESFPTITAHGTECTEAEAKAAKAAAAAMWMKLRSNRGEAN